MDAIVADFEELSYDFPGETDENHEEYKIR
jgi:hypothetical protein